MSKRQERRMESELEDFGVDPDFTRLHQIFLIKKATWLFKGIDLHDAIRTLQQELIMGNLGGAGEKAVKNAIIAAREAVPEQFERNEIAYLLIQGLTKYYK